MHQSEWRLTQRYSPLKKTGAVGPRSGFWCVCVCVCGGGGGLSERELTTRLGGSGGMLPRKKSKRKSSEKARNAFKTVHTDVNI